MKLLTMKCIKDPELLPEECGGMLGKEEYFVKLETKDEFKLYEKTHDSNLVDSSQSYNEGYWDCAMYSLIGVTEGDVYFYFHPLDKYPEIGETYTDADGLVWERVEE